MNKIKNFIKFKQLITHLGGKLLEDQWLGHSKKYLIELPNNIKFFSSPQYIQKNGFPKEYKQFQKKQLYDENEIFNKMLLRVKHKEGTFDSPKYLGSNEIHQYSTKEGISFLSTPIRILKGYWKKPNLSFFIAENYCREVLKHITGFYFLSTRSILTSKLTGLKNNIELDGYCSELNVAFEYQGHESHWNPTSNKYLEVKERDQLKQKICLEQNILLIIIERIPKYTQKNFNKLFYQILHYLEKNKPEIILNSTLLPFSRQPSSFHPSLTKLKNIAEINSSKLIDNEWKGNEHLYTFQTENGTLFKRKAKYVFKKKWSTLQTKKINIKKDINSNNIKKFEYFNKLKETLSLQNIELIETEYLGYNKLHKLKLSNGIEIERTPKKIYERCFPQNHDDFLKNYIQNKETKNIDINQSNNKKFQNLINFNQLKKILSEENIELLETQYLGYNTLHKIKLSNGVEIERTPKKIKEKGFPKNHDDFLKNFQSKKKLKN